MPITIDWDSPDHHVIRYDFVGTWTWQEYHAAVQQVADLLANVAQPVAIIANFTESGPLPNDSIRNVRRALDNSPDNWSEVIVVGGGMFIRMMVSTFGRLYPAMGGRIHAVATLEAARAHVEANQQGNN